MLLRSHVGLILGTPGDTGQQGVCCLNLQDQSQCHVCRSPRQEAPQGRRVGLPGPMGATPASQDTGAPCRALLLSTALSTPSRSHLHHQMGTEAAAATAMATATELQSGRPEGSGRCAAGSAQGG